MGSSTLLPLRIDFGIATPWVPTRLGLHLDGLVGFAIKEAADLEGRVYTSFDELLVDLPFGKHVTANGWCWQASLVRPVKVLGTARQYFTAKTATLAMANAMVDGRISGRIPKILDTVRGPMKNSAEWYTTEIVDVCRAWCIGDPDRLVDLLGHLQYLGRKGKLDHGRIIDFSVDEDSEATTRWRERQMPAPETGFVPVVGRLLPPYWQGEGSTTVWRPE